MKQGNLTVEILKQIRDEIRDLRSDTNERLDGMNRRQDRMNEGLDATNGRLAETNGRLESLERHVVGVEVRLATEIIALRGDLSTAIDLFRGHLDLRPRVERCEQDIAVLKAEVGHT